MNFKKLIVAVFIVAIGMSSCTKTDEVFENDSINARSIDRPATHPQVRPYSLALKGEQLAFVKSSALDDLMTEGNSLQFTVETIFAIDRYSEIRYILSYGKSEERGIRLFLKGEDLYFQLNGNTYHITNEIQEEKCYQVSIARKGNGAMMFYLNGVVVLTAEDTGDFNTYAPLFIGAKGFYSNEENLPQITVDEIRLWKYYLEADEINHYLFTNIAPVDYLLGYYNFNNEPLRGGILDFSEYDSVIYPHHRDGGFAGGANDQNYINELECITFRDIN